MSAVGPLSTGTAMTLCFNSTANVGDPDPNQTFHLGLILNKTSHTVQAQVYDHGCELLGSLTKAISLDAVAAKLGDAPSAIKLNGFGFGQKKNEKRQPDEFDAVVPTPSKRSGPSHPDANDLAIASAALAQTLAIAQGTAEGLPHNPSGHHRRAADADAEADPTPSKRSGPSHPDANDLAIASAALAQTLAIAQGTAEGLPHNPSGHHRRDAEADLNPCDPKVNKGDWHYCTGQSPKGGPNFSIGVRNANANADAEANAEAEAEALHPTTGVPVGDVDNSPDGKPLPLPHDPNHDHGKREAQPHGKAEPRSEAEGKEEEEDKATFPSGIELLVGGGAGKKLNLTLPSTSTAGQSTGAVKGQSQTAPQGQAQLQPEECLCSVATELKYCSCKLFIEDGGVQSVAPPASGGRKAVLALVLGSAVVVAGLV